MAFGGSRLLACAQEEHLTLVCLLLSYRFLALLQPMQICACSKLELLPERTDC